MSNENAPYRKVAHEQTEIMGHLMHTISNKKEVLNPIKLMLNLGSHIDTIIDIFSS